MVIKMMLNIIQIMLTIIMLPIAIICGIFWIAYKSLYFVNHYLACKFYEFKTCIEYDKLAI